MLTGPFRHVTLSRQMLVKLLLLTVLVFSLAFSGTAVFAEGGGGGPQICVTCP